MDYTNHPENNQEPGAVNFQRLRSIYIAGENGAVAGESSVAASKNMDNGGRYLRERGYPRRVIYRFLLSEQSFNDALN